jgi:SAM-dependent methyltransferase
MRSDRAADIFVCPRCRGRLTAGESGFDCADHGHFPLWNATPCFAGATEFDNHWLSNGPAEIPHAKKVVARAFLEPARQMLADVPSVRILDCGCGDGVHASVLMEGGGLDVAASYGVDLAREAVFLASRRAIPGWRFFQGDLQGLPLPECHFDLAFAFGVVEYTSDPAQAVAELCRVVRPGGVVGLWMLPKPSGVTGVALSVLRRLAQLSGAWGARLIADGVVPFLSFVPNKSGLSLRNASWQQCREAVLVNLSPRHLYFGETETVIGWLRRNGVTPVHIDRANPVTVWGRRDS